MKTLKKLLTLAALVLFAMTFTSCKAIFGDGEITVKYAISTVVIALLCFILDVLVCISAEKHGKGVGWAFLDMIIILVPFFWRPFAYFNLLVLGISLVLFFIGLGVSGNQTLKDNAAAEAKAKAEAEEKEDEIPADFPKSPLCSLYTRGHLPKASDKPFRFAENIPSPGEPIHPSGGCITEYPPLVEKTAARYVKYQ